jgi:acetyl esterase/lipase
MRANAKKHKIDPNRIGAIGGSAGGHLVGVLEASSQVARLEGDGGNPDVSTALQAAVIFGGGVDLVSRFEADPDDPSPNALIFFGGSYREKPKMYAEASATTHLDKNTPPTLFMDCSFDQPGERYVTMRKQMDDLGINNEFKLMEGGKHGCWNSHPWFDPMINDVDDFLGRTLKK